MPYFELTTDEFKLPPAYFADLEGLLAVGGTLTSENMLRAYREGVYYWHHPLKRVQWWSPDPRIVLYPGEHKHMSSGNNTEQGSLSIRFNHDFERLLRLSQERYNLKEEMSPYWLSERMFRIFMELHEMGYANSVEAWENETMQGGIFGVAIGDLFFGEYQVARDEGMSLLLLNALLNRLREKEFTLLDMQKPSVFVNGMEYEEMARINFVNHCRQIQFNSSPTPFTLF